MRYPVAVLSLGLSLLATAPMAAAQGIVVERIIVTPPRPTPPRPAPIRLKEQRVRVEIDEQVARTEVTQIFENPNNWDAEGEYLYPLPDGAAVSRFTMRMGDKDVVAEILDADRAREIYRQIVHRRRDPGLLEYAGQRLLRARLFPIPARGETKVTLTFGQVLTPEGGLIEMVVPMRSDKFAPGPVSVSGEISIHSSAGIATLFSPTHALDVARKGPEHWVASFEESRSAGDRDLRVLYGLGRKEFGLSLVSHKPAGEDGYFLMLVSPNTAVADAEVLPRDVVFVIDTSGSMGDRGGKKMRQAKAALGYALGRLTPRDRFNVIAFSTEPRPFRDGVIPASGENVAAAVAYAQGLESTGGTAIHDALLQALAIPRESGRVPIVIFLTDGQPTIGPTDNDTIWKAVERANVAGARLFVFGVGDDLNATLLTGLAERNHGSDNFVAESEDIELKVSALVDKVSSPVLTDATLSIDGDIGYDVYPKRLGDLFKGQQLVIVGRYRTPGARAIRLSGRVGERPVTFVYEATLGERAGEEFLPRLWAVRKVGFLLEEIRRNGPMPELVAEVKRLGIRHGIVTPYTSFLAMEEEELLRRGGVAFPQGADSGGPPSPSSPAPERVRGLRDSASEAEEARGALNDREQAGKAAVGGARLAGRLKEAKSAEELSGIGVKMVAGRTFRLRDGVWEDIALENTVWDGPSRAIEYLGEAWDALLENADVAPLLSVGPRVRFVHDGVLYEIVDSAD